MSDRSVWALTMVSSTLLIKCLRAISVSYLSMEFTVRGTPQCVHRIDNTDFSLHDPLLVTVLDFDRRALDQLAHGLHMTVTYTYKHARGINKSGFFKYMQGEYVNPSQSEGGKDVYYLLKNIEENAEKYATFLGQNKSDIEKLSKFLHEKIRNAMAHQTYLNCTDLSDQTSSSSCDLIKTKTTKECLDKCAVLLQWIVNAAFYQRIRSKVNKILQNIMNMRGVFEDFQRVKQSSSAREATCTDTEKAKDLLQNLLEELEYEENEDETIEDRPITHLINMVLATRLKVTRDY